MSNYIKGDELMLFYNSYAFAYATSHQLSLSTSTIDINHKDAGFWGAKESGKLDWEITTENLYSDDDFDTLYDIYTAGEPVDVVFAKASNYSPNGLESCGGDVAYWTPNSTNYKTGKAIISSLSINANAGENATFSATFTGSGPLTKYPSN